MKLDVLSDLVIAVDTREQQPYKFKGHASVRKKLDAGDYSIKGFEKLIGIERKGSTTDFRMSLGRNHKRFMRELDRLRPYICKVIVVESTLQEVLHPPRLYDRVHPNSIMGSIVKITVDYDIPILFCNGRRRAEEVTLKLLQRFYENFRLGKVE